MLTIAERKRLHEANSGLGHIGKQHHRSSLGGEHTGPPPPRAAGPYDGGVIYLDSFERDRNGDSRFGALSGAAYWLPACIVFWIVFVWFVFPA